MIKERKYNRKIMAETLKLTSPKLSTVKGENYRLKTKLKAMVLVASSESAYTKADLTNKLESYGTNKFMDWLNHIFEVIRRFFTQMWRAITTQIPKLKKNVKMMKKMYSQMVAEDRKHGSKFMHVGFYVRTTDICRDSMNMMKEVRVVTEALNNIVSQRLNDLKNGNKLTKIKNKAIFDILDRETGKWDQKGDSFFSRNAPMQTYMFSEPYFMVDMTPDEFGVDSRNYREITDAGTVARTLEEHYKKLDHYEKIVKDTQGSIDKFDDKRRALMRSINKNTVADGENFKDIKKELEPLLKKYLKMVQNHFANGLKWAGAEMQMLGRMYKLIKSIHKDNFKK